MNVSQGFAKDRFNAARTHVSHCEGTVHCLDGSDIDRITFMLVLPFLCAHQAVDILRRRLYGSYFSELNRQEIDPPAHETMRMPTLCSTVPQSKSFRAPLGPDPGAQ